MKDYRFIVISFLAAGFLFAAACDILRNPLPETARIEISSQQAEEAEVILSLNFLTGRQSVEEEGVIVGDTTIVHFLEADTLNVSIPYNREFDINRRHKFFAQLNIPDTEETPMYRMRIWIDGEERYSATSEDQVDGALRFIYYFRAGEDIIIRPQP